jgi:flagellar protein FlaG
MNGGISPASVQLPRVQVDLREEFTAGASGPIQRQDVSFDGKEQPGDAALNMSRVVDPADIQAAVADIASYVEGLGRSLAITVDEQSGDYIVKVQNADTEEVVRQVPSEELVRVAAAIRAQLDSLDLMGEDGARGLLLEVTV